MAQFIEIIKAFLFGIVEGITEWLPVSSTGHLILVEEFVKFKGVSEDFFSMFEVVIQFGAILAVVILFWNKLWPFGYGDKKILIKKNIFIMWFKIVAACLPAVVLVVFGLDDKFEEMFYNYRTVSIMLILVGVAFIVIESWNKDRTAKITRMSEITYLLAFGIGLFQLIAAIFPGTSRSGATIIGGLLLGMSRGLAAEFTFFLAIPVMFGASLLKLVKFGLHFTGLEAVILLTGMVVSFAVSYFVIKFLMEYIKKHDFKVFGWYRIVLGAAVLLYFALLAGK